MPSVVPERGARRADRRPPEDRQAAILREGDGPPAKAARCAGAIGALASAALGVTVVAVVTVAIAVALGAGFVRGARARSGAGLPAVEAAGGDLAA